MAKLPQGIGHDWTGLSYQERMGRRKPAPVLVFHPLIFLVLLHCMKADGSDFHHASFAAWHYRRRDASSAGDTKRRLFPDRPAYVLD